MRSKKECVFVLNCLLSRGWISAGRLNGEGRERIRGYNPREIERNIGERNGTMGKVRDVEEGNETQEGNEVRISQKESKV